MNTVEKIVAKSKTQKAAVEKIMGLATNVSANVGEMEVAQMVKDLKNGNDTFVSVSCLNAILAAEKLYNLHRTREWLERSKPLDTIAKTIAELDASLAEFFEAAKADPYYRLSWSGSAFEMAAKRKVYLEVQHYLQHYLQAQTDSGTAGPEAWAEVVKEMAVQAMRMASCAGASRSTSQVSNVAEDCLMRAYANIARGDDSTVERIGYWFAEKAKFDREWAEGNYTE